MTTGKVEKVRLEFTRPELITLLGLVFNVVKSKTAAQEVDYSLLRLLAILHHACWKEGGGR